MCWCCMHAIAAAMLDDALAPYRRHVCFTRQKCMYGTYSANKPTAVSQVNDLNLCIFHCKFTSRHILPEIFDKCHFSFILCDATMWVLTASECVMCVVCVCVYVFTGYCFTYRISNYISVWCVEAKISIPVIQSYVCMHAHFYWTSDVHENENNF